MARNFRPTIYRIYHRQNGISISDSLGINKMKVGIFPIGQFKKDNPALDIYINYDEILMLSDTIRLGKFIEAFPDANRYKMGDEVFVGRYSKFGGSTSSKDYGGKPESRIFEINALYNPTKKEARWQVVIYVGEGVLNKTGGIQPKERKMMQKQMIFLSNEEMRRFMIMVDLHIRSYYALHLADMYDMDGGATRNREDIFTADLRDKGYASEENPKPYLYSEKEEEIVEQVSTEGDDDGEIYPVF